MQATRISDGRVVVLKQIWEEDTPTEVDITRFLCDKRNTSDPENHSVFFYDVLHSPIYDVSFLVMPFLMRVHDIRFATVGEVMECFRQVFEVSFSVIQCASSLNSHAGSTLPPSPSCVAPVRPVTSLYYAHKLTGIYRT